MTVAHWDEVEFHHSAKGEMDADWQRLGAAAGPEGVTMLIYGTRDANDICWYPRSQKVFWRGVGVMGRIETLDYFDGEPVEDD